MRDLLLPIHEIFCCKTNNWLGVFSEKIQSIDPVPDPAGSKIDSARAHSVVGQIYSNGLPSIGFYFFISALKCLEPGHLKKSSKAFFPSYQFSSQQFLAVGCRWAVPAGAGVAWLKS